MPNQPEPTVREMLLARIDELVDRMSQDLEKVRAVTEQLEPGRARSCRNAITMASVMIDGIRLRAHAGRSTIPGNEAYVPVAIGLVTILRGKAPRILCSRGPFRVCCRTIRPAVPRVTRLHGGSACAST
jgi:hypothetical protein